MGAVFDTTVIQAHIKLCGPCSDQDNVQNGTTRRGIVLQNGPNGISVIGNLLLWVVGVMPTH